MSAMADDIESAGLRLSQIAASLGGTRGQEVAQVRGVLKGHRCAPVGEVATQAADGGLLTLPAEPPVGTTVRIEGGSSDGQVWEHVHVGLTPDSTIHWRRTTKTSPDWSRWSGLWWRLTEDDAKGQLGLRIVPKPLAVGDAVTRDDVGRLQVGTWVQYAHRGQRGLVTGYEVFDGKPRALVSEHGEQLPFSDLVDEVWPLTVLGLPTGGAS